MSAIIRLPFPARELFPNKTKGRQWGATSKIRAEQRTAGKLCAQAALQTTGPQEWTDSIPVSLLYVMPDKRHRDLDNCLAASKAILDGVAEAMGVDDKRFKPILVDSVVGDGEGCLIAAVGIRIESGVAL